MAMRVIAEGNLTKDPTIRVLDDGRRLMNLSLGVTPRRLNRQTNEWENVGEPVYVDTTLWDGDVDRWEPHLHKGSRVTISGVFQKRTWTGDDGAPRVTDEIGSARMYGLVPQLPQNQGGAHYGQPAGGTQNDPWTLQQPQQAPPQQRPPQQGGWNQADGFEEPPF